MMEERQVAARITESAYEGFRSVTLETERIRLIIIPELGGKIVSIFHKPTSKEWLIGPGRRTLRRVDYGSVYDDADLSGWDECFPTIISCEYPVEGQFVGRLIPDHGELWSIPWRASIDSESLTVEVEGIALPYTFARETVFIDESTFRLKYKIDNHSRETISVFWTAHPLFTATEHTRIVLPEDMTEVLCVDGGRQLENGCVYRWPEADSEGTLPLRIDCIASPTAKDSRKFYIDGRVKQGHAGLYEENNGEFITLEWSPDELPYFGMWINEGNMIESSVCALEPCNGYYDSLTEAYNRGRLLRIPPGETVHWYLDVRIGVDR